jgi:hypothetical protein
MTIENAASLRPLYAASLGEAAFGIFPNLAGKRRGVR